MAWFNLSKTQYLTMAAGSASGESYILGNTLKTVVQRHYPKIRMTLLETGGAVENLQMLEDGRAQPASAQADILPGPAARIVAILYDDTSQLSEGLSIRAGPCSKLRWMSRGIAALSWLPLAQASFVS
jgi:hypothetical protein